MANYAPNLIRASHEGSINNGEEIFSWGCWLQAESNPGSTEAWNVGLAALAAAMATDFALRWVDVDQLFPTTVKHSNLKLSALDTSGAVIAQVDWPLNGVTGYAGTGSGSLPFSSSIVVSLMGYGAGTFVPNKAQKRNRFYLPPMTTGVMSGNTGRISLTTAATIANWALDLMNDYGNNTMGELGPPVNAVVASGTGATAIPIQRVQVGDILDTQRRRRNQMAELYTAGV